MSTEKFENDVLTEIPLEEWPALRDMFKVNWPDHVLPFMAINSYLDKKKRNVLFGISIHCLNGDWSDGTIIIRERFLRNVYSLEESCDRLKRALLLDDWSHTPKFNPYHINHKAAIDYVFGKLNLEPLYLDLTNMYWLPIEEVLERELVVPAGFYIAPVKPEYAEFIMSIWPHRNNHSKNYLHELITTNISRGLYKEDTHELVSWMLRAHNGVMGMLHTHPDHTRKGYAEIVVRAITKAIAESGEETMATIIEGNVPSEKLYLKLGYRIIGQCYWCRPKNPLPGSNGLYNDPYC